MQRYTFYPKHRAKILHFLPKYYPKPKDRAKIVRFYPKYHPKQKSPSVDGLVAQPFISA